MRFCVVVMAASVSLVCAGAVGAVPGKNKKESGKPVKVAKLKKKSYNYDMSPPKDGIPINYDTDIVISNADFTSRVVSRKKIIPTPTPEEAQKETQRLINAAILEAAQRPEFWEKRKRNAERQELLEMRETVEELSGKVDEQESLIEDLESEVKKAKTNRR